MPSMPAWPNSLKRCSERWWGGTNGAAFVNSAKLRDKSLGLGQFYVFAQDFYIYVYHIVLCCSWHCFSLVKNTDVAISKLEISEAGCNMHKFKHGSTRDPSGRWSWVCRSDIVFPWRMLVCGLGKNAHFTNRYNQSFMFLFFHQPCETYFVHVILFGNLIYCDHWVASIYLDPVSNHLKS